MSYTPAPWIIHEDGKITGMNDEVVGTCNIASEADRDLVQVAPVLMDHIRDAMETLGNIGASLEALVQSESVSAETHRVTLNAMAGICRTSANRLANTVKLMGSK
jgi:hypothetical protein